MENIFKGVTEQLEGTLNLMTAKMTPKQQTQFNVYKQRVVKVMQDNTLSHEEKQVELNKIQEDANKST